MFYIDDGNYPLNFVPYILAMLLILHKTSNQPYRVKNSIIQELETRHSPDKTGVKLMFTLR